jgi:hypothetical protein
MRQEKIKVLGKDRAKAIFLDEKRRIIDVCQENF